MEGWIKLHRKLLSSETFHNEKLLKIFIYCLLKATHTEHEQKVGRQKVDLSPGQFIFGRKKAAEQLDMKESTVRDYMKMLEDDGTITINSTNKYSVITVDNWAFYQNCEENTDSKCDNKSTTNQQQINTNKNVKNDKNKTPSARKRVYEPEHLRLAEYFYSKLLENNEGFKKPNLEKWADDIRLMMQQDKRTEEQIIFLIDWVMKDSFEMTVVLSPGKLRKRFDELVMKVKRERQFKQKERTKEKPAIRSDSIDAGEELAGLEEFANGD